MILWIFGGPARLTVGRSGWDWTGLGLHYWPGTTKRLIRINWIDIGGVQTIHRFGHQSGRGERSGGLSAAKFHDFSARIFLDRSRKP